MIRKWLLVPVLTFFLFGSLQVLSANAARDKAHQLAQAAPQIQAEICSGVSSTEDCHGLFAAGCTASAKYDGYLFFIIPPVGEESSASAGHAQATNLGGKVIERGVTIGPTATFPD